MRQAAKQRGITLISLVVVLALVTFFAICAIKLLPIYQEYYSVSQAMEQVKAEPGVSQLTPAELRAAMFRRFNVSYVESVKKKDIKISRSNGYKMKIKYEVRKPFMGNLDFVAKFEKTVELSG